jgi:asparagine synthase (glutamine-hydrolysing)
MAEALAHRGPDGQGFHYCPKHHVSLAHRRLAITDIEGGEQPMWNEDGSIAVVFNGEIYNHVELRRQLETAGHTFRSDHSDTEVLVHGYEEWGSDLPLRLNGMFAFCVYDSRKGCLFIARDRFGKKPLYYSLLNEAGIVFASELTALLKHPRVPKVLDPLSVKKYFAYGYIPAPASLYQDVYKLPGGCCLFFYLDTSRLEVKTYYRFTVTPDDSMLRAKESDIAEELRAHLTAATKCRLVADRPVGIFLSGGLDSSAILACAAQGTSADRLRTFSIGFREKTYDESDYAQRVASLFGTEHHQKILDIDAARFIAERVMEMLDEPMGDSSILPTYLLAEYARQHVVVALSGDGGDELFAGYAPFRALRPAELYHNLIPTGLQNVIRRCVDRIPTSDRYLSLDFKIKRTLRGLAYPPALWNPVWLSPLLPSEIGDLLDEPVSAEELYADAIQAWEASEAPDLIGKTTEFYARFYMQDGILTKVDRASMMVGLEARAPFLDNEVVEFARRLPSSLKCRSGQGKYILKRAMRGILPDEILDRPKKGFGIPLTAWLKTWKFPASSGVLGYKRQSLNELVDSHRSGRTDERLFLWCWIVLQQHLAHATQL